ncbi:unnamed protein product [Echinostoma caproni]|uniref:Rhodanese domain-containing protein n=1 Tax=Echinostoma caproni TaxID=27848 RepID=A0A183ATC2_9TREM|nr:unnamed protein product [Echinostoma caproni]
MTKKSLYKATCLAELNKLASKPVTFNSPQVVQKTMDECFQRAMQCRQRDEEAAYIFLMRYFDCYERLKFLAGNTVKSSLFNTNLKRQTLLAMDYLERLHKSLEERYEAVRKAHSDPLQLPTPPGNVTAPPTKEPTGWISVTELTSQMRKKKDTLLIFDLRSAANYEKCHIKWNSMINFPAEQNLTRGTTFTIISTTLSNGPFHAHWKNRGKFDQIVLLDDNSGSGMTDIPIANALPRSHPLILMKDAIYKWDASSIVKTEPLILSGGMREFLLRYAPLTTSPDHRIDQSDHDTSSVGTGLPASSIDYPDMAAKDKEFEEAQRRRKRLEELEEEARRKKIEAAELEASTLKQAALAAVRGESRTVRTPNSLPSKEEHKTNQGLNDMNAVFPQEPTPRASADSPSELDLEERLRVLRVCKPRLSTTTVASKSTESNEPTLLQPPPQVDRTRKPSVLSSNSPNSLDVLPQPSSVERGRDSGERVPTNGLPHSASSQEISSPFVPINEIGPDRIESDVTGMSRHGTDHAPLGSRLGQAMSNVDLSTSSKSKLIPSNQ